MKKTLTDLAFILLGGVIWALGLNTFLFPNFIAAGGIAGLATVIEHFLPLSVGVLIILLNIPIFIFSFIKKGVGYSLRTFLVMAGTSVIIDVSALFMPVFTDDKLFAVLIGSVLSGVGLGLIYTRGFATGGTDLLASLISDRLPTFSYGQLILALDAMVVIIAAICYWDWRPALYSACAVYIMGEVVDKVLSGVNTGKVVYIISKEHEKIADRILTGMNRGVTLLDGQGGFTRLRMPVLMTVVRRYELYKIKEITAECDREAFVIVNDVAEIQGEGFTGDIPS